MATTNRDLSGIGSSVSLGSGGSVLSSESDGLVSVKTSGGVLGSLQVGAATAGDHVIQKDQLLSAISDLLSSVPTSLNTLQKLGAAIGDDPAFSVTMATSLGLKAPINNAGLTGATTAEAITVTGNVTAPQYHSDGHLVLKAQTNDMNIFLDNTETLQLTRSGDQCRMTSNGGTGTFKMMQSCELAGTPTAPTASASTNTTQLATTEFVTTAVANLIDGADASLDTLKEISEALNNDDEVADNLTALIVANEAHIDNSATLSGVAKDATHLATFTGSTIADNQTVKAAIQALETKVEAVSADNDQNEADSDAAIASVQADVDSNESASVASLALKANAANAALTGTTTAAEIDCSGEVSGSEFHSAGGHIKMKSVTNDFILYLNSAEQFQVSRHSSGNTHFTSGGGSKSFKFTSSVDMTELQLNGTAVTASAAELNYCDGVSSNIQTQITALQSDIDTNESDSDTALALKANIASPTFTGTVGGITSTMVGLGNCDNTSDASKEVSTATQTALDLKSNLASPHFTGNVGIGTSSPDGDTVFTVTGEGKYGTNGVMSIEDNTAMEAGNGGGIALKGIRDVAGNQTVYGGIRAVKDNGTGGHFGASIELVSRANGSGDPECGFKVNSDQSCTATSSIAFTDSSDPSAVSGFSHIYSKSGEAYVQDQSGNATKISPHNVNGEWEYFSQNSETGKIVRINMEAMIRDLEQLTGKTYIEDE